MLLFLILNLADVFRTFSTEPRKAPNCFSLGLFTIEEIEPNCGFWQTVRWNTSKRFQDWTAEGVVRVTDVTKGATIHFSSTFVQKNWQKLPENSWKNSFPNYFRDFADFSPINISEKSKINKIICLLKKTNRPTLSRCLLAPALHSFSTIVASMADCEPICANAATLIASDAPKPIDPHPATSQPPVQGICGRPAIRSLTFFARNLSNYSFAFFFVCIWRNFVWWCMWQATFAR